MLLRVVRLVRSRHCARELCSKCTNYKSAIPKFDEMKPQRVCELCYEALTQSATVSASWRPVRSGLG